MGCSRWEFPACRVGVVPLSEYIRWSDYKNVAECGIQAPIVLKVAAGRTVLWAYDLGRNGPTDLLRLRAVKG